MADEYDFILVRGARRYRKNKKMVNKNTLPRDVMERYGLVGEQPPEETDEPHDDPRACIFCGEHSRFTRRLNGQTVYICDADYYVKTIGSIAQRLRELKGVQHAQSEEER